MHDRLKAVLSKGITEARCDTTYPPGTVGVLSADLTRYSSFAVSMLGVKFPYNTTINWRHGCDIIDHLNRFVRDLHGDWLWILGDDHVFDPNLLACLLSRMYDDECDLVAPLVLSRVPPFPTVIGSVHEAEKRIVLMPVRDCVGLMKVDMVGSAGLLIRRRVFEAVGEPYFAAGEINRTGLGEDWFFCRKAAKAGFQTYVDANLHMGHTTSLVVWPGLPGTATAGAVLDLGSGHHVSIQHTHQEPA